MPSVGAVQIRARELWIKHKLRLKLNGWGSAPSVGSEFIALCAQQRSAANGLLYERGVLPRDVRQINTLQWSEGSPKRCSPLPKHDPQFTAQGNRLPHFHYRA